MNYRLAGKVKLVLYAASVVLAVASMLISTARTPCLIGAFVAMAAGVAVQLAFYRCPHCGAALPANEPLPKRCPKCRMELR